MCLLLLTSSFPYLCHPERSFSPKAECAVKDLYAGTVNDTVQQHTDPSLRFIARYPPKADSAPFRSFWMTEIGKGLLQSIINLPMEGRVIFNKLAPGAGNIYLQ